MFYFTEGVWDSIRYDTDDQNGANIRAAVEKARSILSAGRRNKPGVTSQSMWLVTDGEYSNDEMALWTSYVKDDSTSCLTLCKRWSTVTLS